MILKPSKNYPNPKAFIMKRYFLLLFLFLFIMNEALSQDSIGRIETGMLFSVIDINHNGTGFLVSRQKNGSGRQFFLVTNKHMIGE